MHFPRFGTYSLLNLDLKFLARIRPTFGSRLFNIVKKVIIEKVSGCSTVGRVVTSNNAKIIFITNVIDENKEK